MVPRSLSPTNPDRPGDDEGILARVGISLMAEVALWDAAAIYKPWSIVILLLAMRLHRIAEQVAHFELK
jgi:hypothetical protein